MNVFEKAQKNLKNDMIGLFFLELIILVFSIYTGNINIFSIGFAVFLFIGYNLAKNGSKSAGTIGIIVGILMMLTIITGDIIDFLLGLFVIMHSTKYNKSFN
ncbi:MAG: hypothetical protein MR765_00190 [Tenericutes bacterium]|nr:hypothetical protein [Mycoplasmatota bacterium]